MDCVFVGKAYDWKCANCGQPWPFETPPNGMTCRLTPPDPTAIKIAESPLRERRGTGDCLHASIRRWFGAEPTRECACTDKIVAMNAWGADGCREHIDEIVGWLVEQAKNHKWLDRPTPKIVRLNRWLMKLPGGMIPAAIVCRRMVLNAIRKAENEAERY